MCRSEIYVYARRPSEGFGFIQMTTLDEAKRAVEELHDKEYMGRKLVVSGAKALPEMRAERPAAPAAASESESCCHGDTHCHEETPEQNATPEVTHENHSCCNHESSEESCHV